MFSFRGVKSIKLTLNSSCRPGQSPRPERGRQNSAPSWLRVPHRRPEKPFISTLTCHALPLSAYWKAANLNHISLHGVEIYSGKTCYNFQRSYRPATCEKNNQKVQIIQKHFTINNVSLLTTNINNVHKCERCSQIQLICNSIQVVCGIFKNLRLIFMVRLKTCLKTLLLR